MRNSIDDYISDVYKSQDEKFTTLVSISGLDKATDFIGSDLRGVDFSDCDLGGFDFRKANLEECTFVGAKISYAVFDPGNKLLQQLAEASDYQRYISVRSMISIRKYVLSVSSTSGKKRRRDNIIDVNSRFNTLFGYNIASAIKKSSKSEGNLANRLLDAGEALVETLCSSGQYTIARNLSCKFGESFGIRYEDQEIREYSAVDDEVIVNVEGCPPAVLARYATLSSVYEACITESLSVGNYLSAVNAFARFYAYAYDEFYRWPEVIVLCGTVFLNFAIKLRDLALAHAIAKQLEVVLRLVPSKSGQVYSRAIAAIDRIKSEQVIVDWDESDEIGDGEISIAFKKWKSRLSGEIKANSTAPGDRR